MKLQIENAKTRFFNGKDQYLAFKKRWGAIMSDKEKREVLGSMHHALYNLLCGRDLTNSFSLVTTRRKIENGAIINYGIVYAISRIKHLERCIKVTQEPRPKDKIGWGGKRITCYDAQNWDNCKRILDNLTDIFGSEFSKPLNEIILEIISELPKMYFISNLHYSYYMPDEITFNSIEDITNNKDKYRKPAGLYTSTWHLYSDKEDLEVKLSNRKKLKGAA